MTHNAEELKNSFNAHTSQHSPTVFLLPAGAWFFLGGIWPEDGDGLKLSGGSVTIAGTGEGTTLDAEERGRMFRVDAGNLTVRNVHLVNGLGKTNNVVRPLVPLLAFARIIARRDKTPQCYFGPCG
jgi:hypothetical protein